MFIRDGFKLLFTHPPKTGGISIGTFLLENNFRYSQEHLSENLKKQYERYGNHHVDSRLIPDIDYDFTFSIFRDPIERLKSAYKHRFSEEYDFEYFVDKSFSEYDINSCDMISQCIKPQVEYYTKKCKIFLFKNINKLPQYLKEFGIENNGNLKHLNSSKDINIHISNSIEEKIKNFYKEDYLFLSKI